MIGALLVPALAGFILLFGTKVFRYWLNRQGGYKLLFATALAGAVLLALARGVEIALGDQFIPSWWDNYAPFEWSATVGLSVLIAVVLAVLINLGVWKSYAAKLVSRNSGDLIECLLEDCLEQNALVELTMSNGKVYIGFPRESGLTVTGESDIAIVPLKSGYRDEQTKTLEITTNYAPTLHTLVYENRMLSLDDFQVVLPLKEVASARYHQENAYDQLQMTGREGIPEMRASESAR